MPTLREVRGRIVGVKKTQKITRAMKMVAAAKLRRAQANLLATRPYATKMKELLAHLSSSADAGANPLLAPREIRNRAFVVITSDRGFCGAFNSNLLKAAVGHIDAKYATERSHGRLQLFCVGRKGFDFFKKRGYTIAKRYVGVYNQLAFGQAQAVARELTDGFLKGDYDSVDIIYNEFKSITQQRVVVEPFLPVPPEEIAASGEEQRKPASFDYIYEPSREEIVGALIPRHLNFHVWRILLESNTSEEGARMAAMDNATSNASDMINNLQLMYNKARQASITKELLEVVSGADALKKVG
jgi:F-type H+-transporting ATPase subunit gamma